MNNQDLARYGEDLAAAHLAERGYRILLRNFHFGKSGEIDIIAQDGDTTVFVEVKTRRGGNPEEGLYAITPTKARQLRSIARGYMYTKGLDALPCRFDVVSIAIERDKPLILHIPNALTFM